MKMQVEVFWIMIACSDVEGQAVCFYGVNLLILNYGSLNPACSVYCEHQTQLLQTENEDQNKTNKLYDF
jgi:hypothetical protein